MTKYTKLGFCVHYHMVVRIRKRNLKKLRENLLANMKDQLRLSLEQKFSMVVKNYFPIFVRFID